MDRFLLSRYIKLLLTESKTDDLKKKYPDIDVDFYSANDPSQKNKYLEWMVRQAAKGHSQEDIVATVSYFHVNSSKFQNKDINSYKDLKDLENEAKEVSEKKSKTQQRKEVKTSGSEDIYEDDEIIVKYIKEKDACQVYGSGTKWCITMRDASYWEQYVGSNVVFYYVLRKEPKKNKFDKVAISVERNFDNKILDIKYWDSRDKNPAKSELLKLFKNFNKFSSLIKSHALTVPKGILAKIKDKEATEEEIYQALEMYKDDEKTLAFIIQFINKIKPEKLAELSRHKNIRVRKSVALNPSTPSETLTELSKDEDKEIRYSVASNPSAPSEVLKEFSRDENEEIRYRVANNPNTSTEILTKLSRDKEWIIRIGVVNNINTSLKVLMELSKDEDRNIRLAIAQNPSTSSDILINLSKDEYMNVRYRVARNPSTSSETLTELSQNEDWHVRRAAKISLAARN